MRKDVRLGLAIGGSAIVIVACSVLFFRNPEPKPASQASQNPPAAPGITPVDPSGQGDAVAQGTGMGFGTGADGGSGLGTVNVGPSDLHGTGSTGTGMTDVAGPGTALGTGTGTSLGTGTGDAMAGGTTAGAGSSWQDLLDTGGGAVTRTTTPVFSGTTDIDGGGSTTLGGTSLGGSSFGGAVTPPVSAGPKTHIVEPGDTYWTIAAKEYGNGAYYTHIMRANPGVPANRLKANVKLIIPDRSTVVPAGAPPVAGGSATVDARTQYRVQQGDNLYNICKKLYGKTDKVAKLYQLNKALIGPNPSALKLNMVLQLPDAPAETDTSVGTIQ